MQVSVVARANYSVKTAEAPAVRAEGAVQAAQAAVPVVVEAEECSAGADGSAARR